MKWDRRGLEILPEHMHCGVILWIEQGVDGGSFQSAVMRNNLVEAYGAADHINLASMRQWAEFLYLYAPSGSWGSEKQINEWRKHRGLSGLQARMDTETSRVLRGEEPMEE